MQLSAVILKLVKVMMNVRNVRVVTRKEKNRYVGLYVIYVNGTIKTIFMSNLSHPFILLD